MNTEFKDLLDNVFSQVENYGVEMLQDILPILKDASVSAAKCARGGDETLSYHYFTGHRIDVVKGYLMNGREPQQEK
jgi:hypothetical protein